MRMNSKESQVRVSAGSANRAGDCRQIIRIGLRQYAAGTAGDKLVSQKIKSIFRCRSLRISGNAMSNISQRVEFIGSKPVRGPYAARIEPRPRSHFAISVCRERAVRKCRGARDQRHAARSSIPISGSPCFRKVLSCSSVSQMRRVEFADRARESLRAVVHRVIVRQPHDLEARPLQVFGDHAVLRHVRAQMNVSAAVVVLRRGVVFGERHFKISEADVSRLNNFRQRKKFL